MKTFPKITLNSIDIRKGINLPKKLNTELAELCGIHIGDGYMGYRKSKGDYLIQCFGNAILEKNYYDKFIKKLWKDTFNLDIKLRSKIDNCYGYGIYSKAILTFFNKNLEMPIGKKSKIIRIPKIIKNTCTLNKVSREMIACIRGIIDTDFYLYITKNSLRLGGWFASKKLVLDLFYYFKLLGLRPRKIVNEIYFNTSAKKYLTRHKIEIPKQEDIHTWFSLIKSHNPKILKRYNNFRKS